MKTACLFVLVCLGVALAFEHPCTREYFPVCGEDGKVYSNPCSMRNSGVSSGDWEGCRRANHPLCPLVCTLEYAPVCGSDGVVYPNKCGMHSANCGKMMGLRDMSFCKAE